MKIILRLLSFIIVFLGAASANAVNLTPREIYSKDAPAVVFISAYDQGSSLGNAGTGSIITPEGLVLTNCHVITNANTKRPYGTIVVCLKPVKLTGEAKDDLKQYLSARVVSRDIELDLAVLKLENVQVALSTMPVGDAGEVSTGDPVAAIGHPEGGGLWILTTGTISGVKKIGPQDVFQTEASINRGNSGGPLIDSYGNMIGINTSMLRKSADNMAIVGINFSVKSNQVKRWLDSQGINIAICPSARTDTTENVGLAHVKKEQTEPELKKPANTPPDTSTGSKQTSQTKTKSKHEKPIAKAEDDPKEFKGPDGEIMYGIQDGKFNLDDTQKMIFDRVRKNAQKAFDELDEAE
jgi:serine protease Do